jgi:hypothetical protein
MLNMLTGYKQTNSATTATKAKRQVVMA